jgi:hypothetical protein
MNASTDLAMVFLGVATVIRVTDEALRLFDLRRRAAWTLYGFETAVAQSPKAAHTRPISSMLREGDQPCQQTVVSVRRWPQSR